VQFFNNINSAVVDLFYLFFDPVGPGENRKTVSDLPYWTRSLVGWLTIARVLSGVFFLV